MNDWETHLPHLVGANKITMRSITEVSSHMMATRHERANMLTLFCSKNERQKTAPQIYIWDIIKSNQEFKIYEKKYTINTDNTKDKLQQKKRLEIIVGEVI